MSARTKTVGLVDLVHLVRRVCLVYLVNLVLLNQRNQRNQTNHMDKNEQSSRVGMALHPSAGGNLTDLGIRGVIRYGTPVCVRVLSTC